MSESIASSMYKKYKVSINVMGGWHDGDIERSSFGYSVTVFGVTLKSSKSYKRYGDVKTTNGDVTASTIHGKVTTVNGDIN